MWLLRYSLIFWFRWWKVETNIKNVHFYKNIEKVLYKIKFAIFTTKLNKKICLPKEYNSTILRNHCHILFIEIFISSNNVKPNNRKLSSQVPLCRRWPTNLGAAPFASPARSCPALRSPFRRCRPTWRCWCWRTASWAASALASSTCLRWWPSATTSRPSARSPRALPCADLASALSPSRPSPTTCWKGSVDGRAPTSSLPASSLTAPWVRIYIPEQRTILF